MSFRNENHDFVEGLDCSAGSAGVALRGAEGHRGSSLDVRFRAALADIEQCGLAWQRVQQKLFPQDALRETAC